MKKSKSYVLNYQSGSRECVNNSLKRNLLFLGLAILLLGKLQAQSGLYMRTQFWGSSLDVSWLFFVNGQDKKLVRNPLFGVNPLQLSKELQENKKNVANFSLSGNKMTLRWGDGTTQTVNVEFKDGKLSGFDGGVCSRASAFPFKFFPDLTYSGSAGYGSVGRSVTLFFGKDGKFRGDRLGFISGSGNTSGAVASQSTENGTYLINGNTIIFKYSDGKEWRVVAQPYDLGQNDIIINDQRFKQK